MGFQYVFMHKGFYCIFDGGIFYFLLFKCFFILFVRRRVFILKICAGVFSGDFYLHKILMFYRGSKRWALFEIKNSLQTEAWTIRSGNGFPVDFYELWIRDLCFRLTCLAPQETCLFSDKKRYVWIKNVHSVFGATD